jgi:hypothetical protein
MVAKPTLPEEIPSQNKNTQILFEPPTAKNATLASNVL